MEFSVNNSSASAYAQNQETRAEQWQAAAAARKVRGQTRATELEQSQRVIEAFKVERLNHAHDARELRPIVYDNTHLNKVRSFLTVAQNGKQSPLIDLYV